MDFNFNKEQKMFKKSARSFFTKEWTLELMRELIKEGKGYSVDHWKKIVELDWPGMLIEEQYEGIGASFFDVCPILEEMGRSLFPSPFFSSAICGVSILSEAANEKMKTNILPGIANGKTLVTVAVAENGNGWWKDEINTKASKQANSYVINGTKLFVPFADYSDYIICCAKDESAERDGITLFLIDAKTEGIEYSSIPTFSIEQYNKVVFNNVSVSEDAIIGKPGLGLQTLEKVFPKLVISRCLEMVGGLQKVLEMTLQWVKEREQFGNPIGSFQAIQHKCAEMAIDVETSKFITYRAAWKVSENIDYETDVSMAKSWSGDAFQRVTTNSLQVHGAMGFTDEYDLHFYYKQAKSLQLMYGGGMYHRNIIAQKNGYTK